MPQPVPKTVQIANPDRKVRVRKCGASRASDSPPIPGNQNPQDEKTSQHRRDERAGQGAPQMISALHYHVTDPLGTRRLQADAQGVPEMDCQSLPFGDQLNCFTDPNGNGNLDDSTPLHFTGKERDAETGEANGNDYFGARYFASGLGRFMTPDWSAKYDPVPYAKLDNPQTLNLYAYVQNNPLTMRDPDGHEDAGTEGADSSATSDGDGDGSPSTITGTDVMDAFEHGDTALKPANSSTGTGHGTQQGPQDITPEQGQAILKQAQTYTGTPYTQNTVPPYNTKGRKGPKSGIDCSHLVCFAANIPYANANALQHSKHLRHLGPGEQRQAADVVIFVDAKGHGFHVAFWDPNPPIRGSNIYGATSSHNNPSHNLQWLPLKNRRGMSTFGGTPTFVG